MAELNWPIKIVENYVAINDLREIYLLRKSEYK